MKIKKKRLRKVTHSFEVHSNESACRKSGRLGLEQVNREEKDMDQSEYIPIVKGIMPWFSEDILG